MNVLIDLRGRYQLLYPLSAGILGKKKKKHWWQGLQQQRKIVGSGVTDLHLRSQFSLIIYRLVLNLFSKHPGSATHAFAQLRTIICQSCSTPVLILSCTDFDPVLLALAYFLTFQQQGYIREPLTNVFPKKATVEIVTTAER